MLNWQKHENVTPLLLDNNRIIYDPDWFFDDNGVMVDRDPYEFLRDHLGYRLRAESISVLGREELEVELKIKNYGFAAAFYLESSIAILDENYNAVSSHEVGNPETWYSHNPKNHLSTEVLTHTLLTEFVTPEKEGKYYIALRLGNTMGDTARLANSGIDYQNGYNILYSFLVD